MREWEKGRNKLELMENAGKAIAQETSKFRKVVFVCGSGNNGGDGYTAARYCPQAKVFKLLEPKTEEARINHERLAADRFVSGFSGFDCIVDCLLGTGIQGELREPVRSIVEEINHENAFVLSVDVPTGLGTSRQVKADLTVCLQFAKKGMQGKNFVVRKIDGKVL